jgi:hypothetical protein
LIPIWFFGITEHGFKEIVGVLAHVLSIATLQGAANRRVAATNMNRESSRSHSVFTCIVKSKVQHPSSATLFISAEDFPFAWSIYMLMMST